MVERDTIRNYVDAIVRDTLPNYALSKRFSHNHDVLSLRQEPAFEAEKGSTRDSILQHSECYQVIRPEVPYLQHQGDTAHATEHCGRDMREKGRRAGDHYIEPRVACKRVEKTRDHKADVVNNLRPEAASIARVEPRAKRSDPLPVFFHEQLA
jgi:hypothetical protein